MQELNYHLLDVFTDQPFGGNPLAVFPDAADLPAALMQRIAAELNLSETVFIQAPQDSAHHYRLRIFTPAQELPMAGHPTIGTACLLVQLGRLRAGSGAAVHFEEGVGPVPVRLLPAVFGDGLVVAEMQQPQPEFGRLVTDRAAVARLLSLREDDIHPEYPMQVVSTGVPFLYVPLVTREAVDRAQVRLDLWGEHWQGTDAAHLFVFTLKTGRQDIATYSRMFAPAMGIDEDPATGAASGPLAAYLVHYAIHPAGQTLTGLQGVAMGRPSTIQMRVVMEDGRIEQVIVGGTSVYMGHGTLRVPTEV